MHFFKRSAPTADIYKAAEGETVVAIAVVRRVDGASIKFEVVRVGSRRVGARRPIVAVLASVPQDSKININIPAAHHKGT